MAKVVAFLQNCWFKPGTPDIIIQQYLNDQNFRRKYLAKSVTGKRLVRAFGLHYMDIIWENASPLVANHSSGKFPASKEHMLGVLDRYQPHGILCFGNHALRGMQELVVLSGRTYDFHFCPHPVSFGIRQDQLNDFAREIIRRYF